MATLIEQLEDARAEIRELKEQSDKLAEALKEANKILRVAINSYLEMQEFLAAPEADTCVSSNDFREALSNADKILEMK